MARAGTQRIADPTIAAVLKQFLDDQRGRIAAKTFARYEGAVDLLQHSLNGYAYQCLDKADSALFDRLYNAKGTEHREFCEIFGPEHILPNVGEFLGYFMIRKVIAGKETLRAAGTMTKKLAKWLAEKGYVKPDSAAEAAERGGRAARELPEADKLGELLHEFAEMQERDHGGVIVEDHFTITRVEQGRIWLEVMTERRAPVRIDIPDDISRRCKVGWSISGVLERAGKAWRLVEVWNVYPR